MYCKHHTKGVVLSGKNEENDSRRVCLFTEQFGVISAKVQGARNVKSRLRGGVQDFSLGEFSLIRGRSGWKVVSMRAESNLFEIFKNDAEKLKITGNIFGLLKKLVSEEIPSTPLFSVVSNFLDFIKGAKKGEVILAECLTLMRILYILGYMKYDPELTIPISSSEIGTEHLNLVAPRRSRIVSLINESLRSA